MMKLESHLVLNKINCKLFVKMTKTKGFKNPKNWAQNQNQRFHQVFQKELEPSPKFPLKIKELDNNGDNFSSFSPLWCIMVPFPHLGVICCIAWPKLVATTIQGYSSISCVTKVTTYNIEDIISQLLILGHIRGRKAFENKLNFGGGKTPRS